MSAELRFVSGTGQFHSNEAGSKIRKPYGTITVEEIEHLALSPQSVAKRDSRWVIPSTLLSRTFKDQEASGVYGFLWADFDEDPKPISAIVQFWEDNIDCKAIMYSSSSATEHRQKSRLVVPIIKPLTWSEWTMAQECLADMMGGAGFVADMAACRAAQLCYLPNQGNFYDAYICSGGTFDPMEFFAVEIEAKKEEIKRQEAVIEASREAAMQRKAEFQASGRESVVEWFNANHPVADVLIEAGYAQRGSNFRHPRSESGSYSANVLDGRVFTFSPSDPLYTGKCGGAHDAFSAFATLFFDGDQGAAAKHIHNHNRGAA